MLEGGDKLTSIEITERLDCSVRAVTQAIKRLLKDPSSNVEFRNLTLSEKEERYGHKFGCKVYIYWLGE